MVMELDLDDILVIVGVAGGLATLHARVTMYDTNTLDDTPF